MLMTVLTLLDQLAQRLCLFAIRLLMDHGVGMLMSQEEIM